MATPLESVVEEAREFVVELELNAVIERDRDETAPLIRRLADRVEELEAALRRIVETAETREYAPQIARQALSTQPHQDNKEM